MCVSQSISHRDLSPPRFSRRRPSRLPRAGSAWAVLVLCSVVLCVCCAVFVNVCVCAFAYLPAREHDVQEPLLHQQLRRAQAVPARVRVCACVLCVCVCVCVREGVSVAVCVKGVIEQLHQKEEKRLQRRDWVRHSITKRQTVYDLIHYNTQRYTTMHMNTTLPNTPLHSTTLH
jgi:hypothetical protein